MVLLTAPPVPWLVTHVASAAASTASSSLRTSLPHCDAPAFAPVGMKSVLMLEKATVLRHDRLDVRHGVVDFVQPDVFDGPLGFAGPGIEGHLLDRTDAGRRRVDDDGELACV